MGRAGGKVGWEWRVALGTWKAPAQGFSVGCPPLLQS